VGYINNKLSVHFSSAKQDWETPQWLFDELNALYGPFTMDVCATADNAKVNYHLGWGGFYSKDTFIDGLNVDWHTLADVCWMNPPYGREIGKWVKKAFEESLKGCKIVCLLPARTDTKWFHEFIYKQENVDVRFLKGRLKFVGAKSSAPFPSMVVIFYPKKK
jgi:phage N-6-adenine-methyltransferase